LIRKHRTELTKRDIEVIQFVFEHRGVSSDQIGKTFFAGLHRSIPHERLRKLSAAGFLKKESVQLANGPTVYFSSTERGVKAMGSEFRYAITVPQFKSDSVAHDLGLVSFRCQLEKMKMVTEYISENVLQSCGCFTESEKLKPFVVLNSDAVLKVQTEKSQYHMALEFEVSAKEQHRYAKKITDYDLMSSIPAVLYVCRNARIEGLIRQTDLEVGQKLSPKILTVVLPDVTSEIHKLAFRGRDGGIFELC
jgi:hypothetical protein